MATSKNTAPDARPPCPARWPAAPRRRGAAAFSLVEIALALGIMAFCLGTVFGLLPLGLTSFRKAMDLSVGSQIAQRIADDVQQTDFTALTSSTPGGTAASTVPFAKPYRYFDEQGGEVSSTSRDVIYQVNTRVAPSTRMPDGSTGTPNLDIATVTIQVANNPGKRPLTQDGTFLWPASKTPTTTFTTYVARNK